MAGMTSRELERCYLAPIYCSTLCKNIFRVRPPKGWKLVTSADDAALIIRVVQFKGLKKETEVLARLVQWVTEKKFRFNVHKTKAKTTR